MTDTRVSPSIDGRVFSGEQINGFEDDPVIRQLREITDSARRSLEDCYKAKDAHGSNPLLTEASALVKTANYADKRRGEILPKFDNALATVKREVEQLEAELNAPLRTNTDANDTLSQREVREYVRGLPKKQRLEFLTNAAQAGDTDALRAVLGARPYLSGLTEPEWKGARHTYHKTHRGEDLRRLEALRHASETLHRTAHIYMKGIMSVVPAKTVNEIRQKAAAADRALREGDTA